MKRLLLLVLGGLLADPALAQTPATFSPAETYDYLGSGVQATGLAVADVNGDGRLDLLVPSANAGKVFVQLNAAPYRYGAATGFFTGNNSFPTGVAVADVNGDNRPDVVTANSRGHSVSVLLGTGTGTFGTAVNYSTGPGSYPYNVTIADVNGDGKPDLLTANYSSSTAGVLLGTGTGTFGAVAAYSTGTGSQPRSLVVADVNGDGKPDLLAANQATNAAGVLLGLGAGTFGAATAYRIGTSRDTLSLAVAEVTGDGRPDLLAANQNRQLVGLLPGTSSGTFGALTTYSTGPGSSPRSLAVADANSDGLPDVLVANYSSSTVGILPGLSGGGYGAATTVSTGPSTYPSVLLAIDLDEDNQPELVMANYNGLSSVLRNTTAIIGLLNRRTFGPAATYNLGSGISPQTVVVADVNADGKPDLLTASPYASIPLVQLGTGTGTFGAPLSGPAGQNGLYDLAVADVNGDSRPDILFTSTTYGYIGLQLNAGGTFAAPTYFSISPTYGALGLAVADVNGDNRPDIVAASPGNQVLLLLGTGPGTFGPATSFSTGLVSNTDVALADVNGDGKRDIVSLNPTGNLVGVLLGTGTGSFGAVSNYTTGPALNRYGVSNQPAGLAVADVNGDNRLDIVTTGSSKAIVLLGTGTGAFGGPLTFPIGAGVGAFGVVVADVNGDGKPDLVTAGYNTGTAAVLLGSGTGSFGPVTTFDAGLYSNPQDVAVADVNGDGKPDLVTANRNNNTTAVLLNTGTLLATVAGSVAGALQVAVYPNPATTSATLAIAGLPATASSLAATLHDALGRPVQRLRVPVVAGAARAEVPTAHLPAGLYLLRLTARDAQGATLGPLPTQRLLVE